MLFLQVEKQESVSAWTSYCAHLFIWILKKRHLIAHVLPLNKHKIQQDLLACFSVL